MSVTLHAAMKSATAKTAADLCRVCREPRGGRGAKGMCGRCYVSAWRSGGKEPSPERKKLPVGEWKNVQVHVELELLGAAERAAKRAGQTLPAWLRDVLREKLGKKP